MIHLAIATPAPELRRTYGRWLGLAAAVVMIGFALVHLFRIDTFIPELDYALPFGGKGAILVALLIIVGEVFAVPFLLRMRLSPLARLLSGLFAILVPLTWLLIAIWNYGLSVSTAQLGEFYDLSSNWLLIGLNVIWLALNYWTLWALGFDAPKRLSK